ncbi:MAG: hypothetical protein H5U38_09220 [Calditrichaeota bacterium]|nr:hypothetical protein [Calditrichota bacterium]
MRLGQRAWLSRLASGLERRQSARRISSASAVTRGWDIDTSRQWWLGYFVAVTCEGFASHPILCFKAGETFRRKSKSGGIMLKGKQRPADTLGTSHPIVREACLQENLRA